MKEKNTKRKALLKILQENYEIEGEFDHKIVPKNKRDISGIEDKTISLYDRGLTTRKINEQAQDLYV